MRWRIQHHSRWMLVMVATAVVAAIAAGGLAIFVPYECERASLYALESRGFDVDRPRRHTYCSYPLRGESWADTAIVENIGPNWLQDYLVKQDIRWLHRVVEIKFLKPTRISDADLEALNSFSNLRKILLRDDIESAELISYLRRRFPKATIVGYRDGPTVGSLVGHRAY